MAVNIWQNSIEKVLLENEKNIAIFENQKKSYEELYKNLDYYNETLSPSVMVPFCNRILMKGNLIHTNEIMVSLGCNYFVKTSSKQAKEICRRRLLKTDAILRDLKKECQFLNDQLNSTRQNVLSNDYKEIIEEYDEEKEKQWKIKHQENLKIQRRKETEESKSLNADNYFEKLDILQLQEEIEMLEKSEKNNLETDTSNCTNPQNKFSNLNQRNKIECLTDEDVMKKLNELELEEEIENKLEMMSENSLPVTEVQQIDEKKDIASECKNNQQENKTTEEIENQSAKHKEEFDLKESILLKKIMEVQNRKQGKCVTEEDLLQRMDDLEELEKLNDELDRLYEEESIYSSEETDEDNIVNNDENTPQIDHNENKKTKKRVTFVDSDEECDNPDTISIHFFHSENSSYNPETESTLTAPSGIYHQFPEYFQKKPKSIIKNSNKMKNEKSSEVSSEPVLNSSDYVSKPSTSASIVLGNIVEHKEDACKINTQPASSPQKPISKFKSMRLSQKMNK